MQLKSYWQQSTNFDRLSTGPQWPLVTEAAVVARRFDGVIGDGSVMGGHVNGDWPGGLGDISQLNGSLEGTAQIGQVSHR